MADRVEQEPKLLHPDRKLVTPLDVFQGAEYFDGNIISGGTVSGGGLSLKVVSSPVRIRLLNLSIFNNEGGWLEVQFRDGGAAGGRVLGPYRVNAYTGVPIPGDQLVGRYFTSSIYAEVRSGWTAQPLSNGVNINAGAIQEPRDYFV